MAAHANCAVGANAATCDTLSPNPYTSTIGSGRNTPSAYTVTLGPGAQVQTTNANAISLHDFATIHLLSGAVVQTVTTRSDVGGGLYGSGNSAVELDEMGRVIVDPGASVIATGTGPASAAIHPIGAGDTIINYGTVQGGPTSAIFFQNLNKAQTSPRNTIENFGVINAVGGGANTGFSGQAVGGLGAIGIDFINGPNGTVKGNLDLQNGNDSVTFFAGSKVTGDVNGGGGTNNFTLDGVAGTSDTLSGSLKNFQSLTKAGQGDWTLAGTLANNGGSVPLAVAVQGGRLILTGDNPAFNGTMLVGSGGALQLGNGGTTGNLSGDITDNGTVAFDRSDIVRFAGVISGAGGLAQIGSGTTVLTANNGFTGGTVISAGTLQLGSGGTTGSVIGPVVDNGTLAFNRSDIVTVPGLISGTGGVSQIGSGTTVLTSDNSYTGVTTISAGTLQLGNGGTTGGIIGPVVNNSALVLDRSNAFTLPGAISGSGSVSQVGSGTTILTGDDSYSGGTVISAGTLQLGNGGSTGGLVGPVVDNGALVFDRSNVLTLSGAISGSGSVSQIGSGTTILAADNSYTGGTVISAGTLQLGNGGTTGSLLGSVVDNGTLSFDRSDVVSFPGVISGSGSVSQIGSGTTILNADNPYTGGTLVQSGTLAVGDAQHGSAALSGGGPILVAAAGTLGGYGSVTGAVTNDGTIAVANAVPAFAGGAAGTFLINGDLSNSGVVRLASPSTIGNVLNVNGNYSGTGGTVVVNTYLNAGGPLANQITDRLLIHGNASGATNVVVNATGPGALTDTTGIGPANIQGISIIQVGGASTAGAFQLPNGYVTSGTAYQYRLIAFGPGSGFGTADPGQSLVGGNGNGWDYRLESSIVTNGTSERLEVAPQVASYLSAANALFNAGFEDLDSLHRRLGEIRDDQTLGVGQKLELFVRAYGERFNYTSSLGFSDFGYNSQQDYAATQFGANWLAVDNGAGTLRVGLAGTLGRLWVQPSAADGPSKGTYNTETLAGTVTWQARSGWYLDGIISGGLFDGEITTAARGDTAGLNGTRIGTSIEGGYPVALGHGFAIEPQVQFVYQHLDFGRRTDVDGIDLDLGSPNQGIFRGGFRFIKHLVSQSGMLITPYLKANILQGLNGGDRVRLSNVAFDTGDYGTAFQIGGGITGTVTRNLSVYGDVAWQQNVGGDGGFRGWAMNGGLRYAFGAPPPPVIGPMLVTPAPAPPMARTYMIFFDWDRSFLSDTARAIVAQAAANSAKISLTRIEVDGYADTTGTHRYNKRLSVRRAKSVAAELVRDGVPQDEISMHGYGDTHLLVETGPNVRNARNRRVEIIFR